MSETRPPGRPDPPDDVALIEAVDGIEEVIDETDLAEA